MYSQSANEIHPGQQTFSPFWALVILFITLGFLQTAYLVDDTSKCDQTQTARAQLKKDFVQARTINQTTEAVGRELIVLSAKSPEARKIVAEFNLEIKNPAPLSE